MQSRSNKNIKGIDISNWQRKIDYRKVKKYKDVVIIKATEGVDFIDKMLQTHYKGAKEAGFKIGFYHFFSDRTDPVQQARDFWNAIKNMQFEVLPVLDVESSKRSRTDITNRCLDFLKEMKKLSGYDCIVYTYTSFAKEKLDNRLRKYPLWIAHYGVDTPRNNGIWNNWVGFQYSDKEKVPGILNSCDANEFTQEIFINKNRSTKKYSVNYCLEYQKWYNQITNTGSPLITDGIYGVTTEKAFVSLLKYIKQSKKYKYCKKFQRFYNSITQTGAPLTTDGYWGTKTKDAVVIMHKLIKREY